MAQTERPKIVTDSDGERREQPERRVEQLWDSTRQVPGSLGKEEQEDIADVEQDADTDTGETDI
jgi:hypothetical protein